MSDFKFVDDPRRGSSSRDPLIAEFAEALRANPGRWAEYPKRSASPGGLAFRINQGGHDSPKPLRGEEFQAISQGSVCYVRFVKDGEE